MKFLLSILTFSISVHLCYSQQGWPPTGAIWHYEEWSQGFGPPTARTYMTITVTGDTMIKGKPCKKVMKTRFFWNCTDDDILTFLYSDSNKVYWYNSILDTFTTLYDFNAEVSDSWEILIDSCAITVTVDSISNLVVNQDTLKVLSVSTNEQSFWDGAIIEGIGHSDYLLPSSYKWWCCEFCGCDMDYIYGLRCYEDSNIGHYESGLNPCDTVIWLSNESSLNQPDKFEIYPNPTNNYLNVEGVRQQATLQLYDYLGKVVLTEQLFSGSNRIEIKNLTNGIYIYRVTGESKVGKVFIEK